MVSNCHTEIFLRELVHVENILSNKASQVILPASGRFLVEDWANILGYEPETLRAKLKAANVRTIVFGNKLIVDAEWFWEDLIACPNEEEVTVKAPSSKKQAAGTGSPSRGGKTGKGSEKPE